MRLGQSKQLVEIDGEPLVHRAARALLASAACEVIVVLGHDAARVRAAIADLHVRTVIAQDHADGMSAALRAGIAALDARCAGALVALTDQPALDSVHLVALRDAWRATPWRAVASAYADILGVPALLPRAWFADIAALRGDTGARALLRARHREVAAISAPAFARDIDTAADLRG